MQPINPAVPAKLPVPFISAPKPSAIMFFDGPQVVASAVRSTRRSNAPMAHLTLRPTTFANCRTVGWMILAGSLVSVRPAIDAFTMALTEKRSTRSSKL